MNRGTMALSSSSITPARLSAALADNANLKFDSLTRLDLPRDVLGQKDEAERQTTTPSVTVKLPACEEISAKLSQTLCGDRHRFWKWK